jgi:hypothetical protein
MGGPKQEENVNQVQGKAGEQAIEHPSDPHFLRGGH